MTGSTKRVRVVATKRPDAMAVAIGPQKALLIKGTIPKMAAAAVNIIGRKRIIAESTIASHGDSPAASCF